MRTRTSAVGATILTVLTIGALSAARPSISAAEDRGENGVALSTEVPASWRATQPDTVPWYVEEQADSGLAVFKRVCQECHEKVDVAGPDFRAKWSGQSVFALFERVRTSMPDSNPGSLPRDDYANVIAYLLRLNGIPANATKLVPDSVTLSSAKLVLPPPTDN